MDTFFDILIPIIGGVVLFLPICVLLEWIREKLFPTPSPPPEPPAPVSTSATCIQTQKPVEKAPPALPVRSSSLPRQRVLDYPKCPIDRCRNEPGKPQVVFRDEGSHCYICCNGHRFTGRE